MAKKRTALSTTAADMAVIRLPSDVLERAKMLLTGAEKKLFAASFGPQLARATRAQTLETMQRARGLRDKWRDLHREQIRAAKKTGGGAAETGRTGAKHDLFAAAVERFEKRLSDLEGGAAPAVKRVAKQPSPTPVAAVAPPPAAAAKRVAKKVARRPTRTISKKARQAGALAALTGTTAAQPVRLDIAKQRSALTAVKAGRFLVEGPGQRRLGHSVARGRRTQARRDTRSR